MIRRSIEKQVEKKPGPFNGKGQIQMAHILNGQEEMSGKGRTFAQVTVFPGSAIGYHVHQGDGETYYILSGRGKYSDNGTICMAEKTLLSDGIFSRTRTYTRKKGMENVHQVD